MPIKNISDSIIFRNSDLFTKRILFHNEQVLCFMLNICPGQALAPHSHEKSTVIMLVISGKGEIKINENVYQVEKGSVIMSEGKDIISIPKTIEPISVFVTISPSPKDPAYAVEIG